MPVSEVPMDALACCCCCCVGVGATELSRLSLCGSGLLSRVDPGGKLVQSNCSECSECGVAGCSVEDERGGGWVVSTDEDEEASGCLGDGGGWVDVSVELDRWTAFGVGGLGVGTEFARLTGC